MAIFLPWGFNRADGVTQLPAAPYGTSGTSAVGTPDPTGDNNVFSNAGSGLMTVEELPESPSIERAEQATASHSFRTSISNALALIGVLPMGTIAQDAFGNIWRILSTSMQCQRGGTAILTVVAESVSFDTPPDEFQVNTVDLGIDILKHPRYFNNIYPLASDTTTDQQIKQSIIRAIQAYRDSPFFPDAANIAGILGLYHEGIRASLSSGSWNYTTNNPSYDPTKPATATLPIGQSPGASDNPIYIWTGIAASNLSASVKLAIAAGSEIIKKLWRMEDSPYLAGIEMKWSQYFFLPPSLNLGSYVEDPTHIVPNYFLQPDRPIWELPPRGGQSFTVAGADNIFAVNAGINPQDYSNTGTPFGSTVISWLRKADEIEYQRTWFKITRTWLGSAYGYWDTDLYGIQNRPAVPSDYDTLL